MNDRHDKLTQLYSTWGDKLLQHTDVLYDIQHNKTFRPITVQVSLTEACDSDCIYCSVLNRPRNSHISWTALCKLLQDFKTLGAKSVEFTGGGNPMLYRDTSSGEVKDVNDAIKCAYDLGYDIGLITNSNDLSKLSTASVDALTWVRVSLAKLDEGRLPCDYRLENVPHEKLGFSYIINARTTEQTLATIADLVELHVDVKFVRFAGDCLIKGNNALVKKNFIDVVNKNDRYKKFFIKTIDNDDSPFEDGCYVGLVRPYVAPDPDGNSTYYVYTCTSHVLNNRNYDPRYALCKIEDIIDAWRLMNQQHAAGDPPYKIEFKMTTGEHCSSETHGWCATCKYCYYKFNNKLLHTVSHEMPDKNFP